jgi:diguanylate cyclase (GGDEF)-like protein
MGRLAVAGMLIAVVALGGLALWSARVTQREAQGLTSVGVQMTGQLRALRALHVIRVETAELEEDYSQAGLDRLRAAEEALPAALERMGDGDAPEAVELAREAMPLATQLIPAVERYLTDPRGDILYRGEDDDDTSEEAVERLIGELELLLNQAGSDPADVLSAKLDEVLDAGSTVNSTALVLVPLGLAFVAVCGSLLRVYRRRSESAMKAALERTAREARTDQLTGLPNRRGLLEELDHWIEGGSAFTIALADLNGFKHYNDTFGHPAGDALLRRLGGKLAAACAGQGFAARLGGDEFCVLSSELGPDPLRDMVCEALSEEGEGFSVSCASGLAAVPAEATDPSAALHIADTRLYAEKANSLARIQGVGIVTADEGVTDGATMPLARALERRYPDLGNHLDRVTRLAVACALDLELPAEEILVIERAAQLYDIGKVALPAAILRKRGGLTDEEEEFMRRHSVIGERLLSGIDNLTPVAAIVRATHERWDGDGYPDQLSGGDIPVGARIIAAVDAFCGMTSDRDGVPARSVAEALAELGRRSGRQFDPSVVAILARVVARGPVAHAPFSSLAPDAPQAG